MLLAERERRPKIFRCTRLPPVACFLLILASGSGSVWAAQYGGGSGTLENPFLIYTPDDFHAIGDNPADWDKHFRLMKDIDLSGYDETNLTLIGHWVGPAHPENQPFAGVFEGGGKTIANFRYKDAKNDYVGLFRCVSGEVRNVKLAHATVVGNASITGSLVGYQASGAVADCAVTDADVTGTTYTGGLIGLADGSTARCSSRGRVAGTWYVGGLVGQVNKGLVSQCYSKTDVEGDDSVGGLVGATTGDTAIVESCYATGRVDGRVNVGGLVVEAGRGGVFKSYSIGRVTGQSFVGGLAGYQRILGKNVPVTGCLWDVQTSHQTTSSGGIGKTTAEMMAIDTFAAMGWDFTLIWTICEGMNYPVLLWQIPPGDVSCPDGVAFMDFAWLAQNWQRDDCMGVNWNCDGADLDESGAVDHRDLVIFAAHWLVGTD